MDREDGQEFHLTSQIAQLHDIVGFQVAKKKIKFARDTDEGFQLYSPGNAVLPTYVDRDDDDRDEDFFDSFDNTNHQQQNLGYGGTNANAAPTTTSATAVTPKKDDKWDEWQDF